MSFMTKGVLTQMVFYTTSHVVWQALAIHFSSQSKTCIIHIHTQLATIKKGTHYANEYFLSIKKLTNELVVVVDHSTMMKSLPMFLLAWDMTVIALCPLSMFA